MGYLASTPKGEVWRMRKLLAVSLLLVTFLVFAAGDVRIPFVHNKATWSQTLTFAVRQFIRVIWDYDETAPVMVDDTTKTASVGTLTFQSNKRFSVYYSTGSLPSGVGISGIRIGTISISNSESSPTPVTMKTLSGNFVVEFWSLPEEDFTVRIDFTFIAM